MRVWGRRPQRVQGRALALVYVGRKKWRCRSTAKFREETSKTTAHRSVLQCKN